MVGFAGVGLGPDGAVGLSHTLPEETSRLNNGNTMEGKMTFMQGPHNNLYFAAR